MSYRILLFHEDPTLANVLSYQLKKSGHTVQWSSETETLHAWAEDKSFDMVIVDVDQHGVTKSKAVSLLMTLKKDTPIIILTDRHEDSDIALGFILGAQDVIRKPFGYGELVSRIHAIMRRVHENTLLQITTRSQEKAYQFGFFKLYPQRLELYFHEHVIKLKQSEYKLIHHFMSFPEQVITKQSLSEVLYGEVKVNSGVVQVIASVRKKLRIAATHVQIETIRNDGYRLSLK
ncbi:response regulator transcription factor [Paenibacillus sp. strain BS8-2]